MYLKKSNLVKFITSEAKKKKVHLYGINLFQEQAPVLHIKVNIHLLQVSSLELNRNALKKKTYHKTYIVFCFFTFHIQQQNNSKLQYNILTCHNFGFLFSFRARNNMKYELILWPQIIIVIEFPAITHLGLIAIVGYATATTIPKMIKTQRM